MTYQPISLQKIDFSKPDGEFIFKGHTYHVKQYLGKYFFKRSINISFDFVYSFKDSYSAEGICEQKYLTEYFEWLITIEECIQRCVQYEKTIFCFGFGNGTYFEFGIGNGVYFSLKYGVWVSFNWKNISHMSLNDILEQPQDFFINEAISVCKNENFKIFNLNSIDFSKPDESFILGSRFYHGKHYLNKYFFKNNFHNGYDFIYSFSCIPYLLEKIFQPNLGRKKNYKSIDNKGDIQRCIQYENTIFCFDCCGWGEYCSFNSRYWIPFIWEPYRQLNLDDILEQPNEFFLEQVASIHHPYYIKIDDEEVHPLLRASCEFKEEKPIKFVRGSESELKWLTQLAAVALPELKLIFEKSSSLKVIYKSNNDCNTGGFVESNIGGWNYEVTLSIQAQQLFNLIFEYNFFSGFNLQRTKYSGCGFDVYEVDSYAIVVEVQAPSQHERLEAMLELQSWLDGKIPDDEIKSYFER